LPAPDEQSPVCFMICSAAGLGPRCSVSQDLSPPVPAMKPSRDMVHWYWAACGSMLPRGVDMSKWDAEFNAKNEAFMRHQERIKALEDVARAIREPGERARAEEEGRKWDQRNDWLEAQEAKRTPAEREARRQAQENQRKEEERQAENARIAAKQKQIGKTGKSLFRTSAWLAVFAIGTFVAWRYGMAHYDPKASASWAEVGRIVGALAAAFVTLVLVFVWLAKFFGFLGSLASRK
jgi:hypothetical protein